MNGPWAKLIPTGILMLILGYLSLPYLDAPPATPAPTTKLPKISALALRPTAPPATERDPFGGSIRFEMADISRGASGPLKKGGRAAATQPGETSGADQGGVAGKIATNKPARDKTKPEKTTANPATARAAIQVKTANTAEDADLVLSATLLHGQRQIALINGRAYRPGESLDASDSPTPCVVAEIHHHRVVLDRDGKRVDLNYPDKSTSSNRGLPGQAGKPKGAKAPGAGGSRGSSTPPRSNSTDRTP